MIHRPSNTNAFEFVRVASLRAAQLMRGCSPRVPSGIRSIVTAQLEVAADTVRADYREVPIGPLDRPTPVRITRD
jgi:hypothetical protein